MKNLNDVMFYQLRELFKEELKAELEPIKADIKEIKLAINSFKEQFTDFEDRTGMI